jgi:hypothetical protein
MPLSDADIPDELVPDAGARDGMEPDGVTQAAPSSAESSS